MLKLKVTELKLADTVCLWNDSPWGWGVVQKIQDGFVHIFRPYGTTADFEYSGGVITYVGFEDVTYDLRSTATFQVSGRKELR